MTGSDCNTVPLPRLPGNFGFATLQQLILLVILLLTVEVLHAQDSTAADTTYRNRVLLLPAVGSTPETGFLFGGVVVPQFKPGGSGPETRSSSVLISAIYTVHSQILTSVVPEIILPEEWWILSGTYYVNYFPEYYWGVGPSARSDDRLSVLYTQVNLEQSVLRRVGRGGVFAGPFLRWSRLYGVRFEDEGEPVPPPDVNGAEGSTSAGFGAILRWDRRNRVMTPTDNHYLEIAIAAYPEWLGSTHPFTSWQVDARKYLNLGGDGSSVLAFQGLARFSTGSPPFRDLALLGGDMINRGYYEGRFRDRNATQLQAEYRQQVIGILGLTLFAGTGEVWDRFGDFTVRNFKWTAGGGFRFNVNPDDPTNLRVDFGFGPGISGFYLQFGEAF